MPSTDENIRNALKVLRKTHENVQKLMTCCKNLSKQSNSGWRELLAGKDYLRHLSRDDCQSWTISSFILLFEKIGGDGNTIYGLEINLDRTKIKTAKFVYDDAIDGEKHISPGDHWKYAHPLWNFKGNFNHEPLGEFIKSEPKSEDVREKYSGLKYVLFAEFPLIEIKADNVREKIFGTFDKLSVS